MAEKYTYSQHPRVAERQKQGPVTVHRVTPAPVRESKIQRFNNRIGLAVTKRIGSMWAAYAFFALSLVSLPAAIATGNLIVIVSWIAQTFLQLVLLPVIIVGQNIQAKASDARAIATYDDAGAILEEAKQIQSHLGAQDQALADLIVKLEALESRIATTAATTAKGATSKPAK